MARKMKILLGVLALAAIAVSDPGIPDIFQAVDDQFTAKMFTVTRKVHQDKSFVQSAFSAMFPLAQLSLAATGVSYNELAGALGMYNQTMTRDAFSYIKDEIASVTGVELKQANKLYISIDYNINVEFDNNTKNVFNSAIERIDFSNQRASAELINAQVSQLTKSKIQKIIDYHMINSKTSALLINAIYFKGNLLSRLTAADQQTFHVSPTETYTVEMMKNVGTFKFHDHVALDAKLVEMPYNGMKTSLVIVLPNQRFGINNLLDKLKDPAAFREARKMMTDSLVHVMLPKFQIDTTTDLKQVLQEMNVKALFDANNANLDNLVAGVNNLHVTTAIQKNLISVDVTGTIGGSESGTVISDRSALSPVAVDNELIAQHPFVFYIMMKDNIIFNGIYKH